MYNIYKVQSAMIQVSDKSATAKTRKWVKQGCLLSPKLFYIFVKQSYNKIKETLARDKIGLIIGGELISFLRFADNVALFASTENSVSRSGKMFPILSP